MKSDTKLRKIELSNNEQQASQATFKVNYIIDVKVKKIRLKAEVTEGLFIILWLDSIMVHTATKEGLS